MKHIIWWERELLDIVAIWSVNQWLSGVSHICKTRKCLQSDNAAARILFTRAMRCHRANDEQISQAMICSQCAGANALIISWWIVKPAATKCGQIVAVNLSLHPIGRMNFQWTVDKSCEINHTYTHTIWRTKSNIYLPEMSESGRFVDNNREREREFGIKNALIHHTEYDIDHYSLHFSNDCKHSRCHKSVHTTRYVCFSPICWYS